MVVLLEVGVDAGVAEHLMAQMEARARDMRPAWRRIIADFVAMERQQFATQGSLTGGWDPLTPEYAAWKAEHYPGKPIMRRTDRLWASLTEGPQVREEHARSLRLGTTVPYAEASSKKRPVVPEVSDSTAEEWAQVLGRWVSEGRA